MLRHITQTQNYNGIIFRYFSINECIYEIKLIAINLHYKYICQLNYVHCCIMLYYMVYGVSWVVGCAVYGVMLLCLYMRGRMRYIVCILHNVVAYMASQDKGSYQLFYTRVQVNHRTCNVSSLCHRKGHLSHKP